MSKIYKKSYNNYLRVIKYTTCKMMCFISQFDMRVLINSFFPCTESLHNGGKMNSLARSNASIYGTKDDLYDRLKRHAYTGKKGTDPQLPS